MNFNEKQNFDETVKNNMPKVFGTDILKEIDFYFKKKRKKKREQQRRRQQQQQQQQQQERRV